MISSPALERKPEKSETFAYDRTIDEKSMHEHSLLPPLVEGSSMRDGGPPEIRHECFQSNCQLMLRLE